MYRFNQLLQGLCGTHDQRSVLACLWLSLTQFTNDIHDEVQRHDTTMANSYIVSRTFIKQVELLINKYLPGELNELKLLLSLNEPDAKMAFTAYKYNHDTSIKIDMNTTLPVFD